MKTLVIGDIHGGLRALEQVLQRAEVTVNDKLIFLGDYVDGWSQSPQVLDFLINLQQTHNCIFVRGNHDALLCDWLLGNHHKLNENLWLVHGGQATITAYKSVNAETRNKHITFLESLQDYYLDSTNRLFIHAGFTNLKGVAHEYFSKLFYWDRTLWETALAMDKSLNINSPFYPNRFKIYTYIYIGHTPVTKIGHDIPVNIANIWNVDTGAGFAGKLTIFDVETHKYWQSDSLPALYPNEIGRQN